MNIIRYLLSVVAPLLTLVACSTAELLNSTIPRSGYAVHKSVAYGDNPRQILDIYVPDNASATNPSTPVIVFFYGGSWQKGSKDLYRFAGQAFASKGYITVVADYRLYPEVYFPAFMEDSAKAFVWAHQHIAEYGGDNKQMVVAGHSAGAYNALMLTLNTTYLRDAGGDAQWIKAAVGIAGPYDFLPFTDPKIIALFSKAEDAATQPITYARKNVPPVLLLTGDDDDEVSPLNSRRLALKLKQFNNRVDEHSYKAVGHIGIVLALASGFRDKAPVLDDIDSFLGDTRTHSPAKDQ